MANEIIIWTVIGLVVILFSLFFAFIFKKIWTFIEKVRLKRTILKQKETFIINGEVIDLKKKLNHGKK